MDGKLEIREKLKSELAKLDLPIYEDLSYQIALNLFNDLGWKQAKTIGITVSRPPEVDTFQIIPKAWEQGKQVVIPKCLPKTKEMEFRILEKFSQLERVYFNLYEPIVDKTKKVDPNQIDLLIVPGLAFNSSGYRLGFGGGYYDRFLKHYNNETVSLAFPQQLVEEIPVEAHDLPVGKIITSQGVFVCGS